MIEKPRLGVNIDHVATLRQARGTKYPEVVYAAAACELGGADLITVHLREDRRHIQDRDVRILREVGSLPLNLEMAATKEMVQIALEVKPDMVTIVPEKREELTTEGGLDIIKNKTQIDDILAPLQEAGIDISLFIDPEKAAIEATLECGYTIIELHTGKYANAHSAEEIEITLGELINASKFANNGELQVNVGHGLNLQNIDNIAAIPNIVDFNIGHSIIARSIFVGLEQAVREMKDAILSYAG
jgi:pyridoxine 5-phosphate synthase